MVGCVGVLREQWCISCGGVVDATTVMGLRVLVRFTARSVISISFSLFIIISDTLRCLVVLNDSPLLYYNNNNNGIASCREIFYKNQ